MCMKERKESHIDDLKEWQRKQYLPGYYLGGKIHPIFKQRTKGLAFGLIVLGIFFVLFGLGFVLFGRTGESWLNAGWFSVFGVLLLVAGISIGIHLQKKSHKSH